MSHGILTFISAGGGQYTKYSPLSRPDEIRCLLFESGNGDDPFVCQIRHINLGEGLPFEAISYVWGSRAKDHGILCDGHSRYH